MLYANLASFVLDYSARQKIAGSHLTYGYFDQLPILPPRAYNIAAPWSDLEALDQWINLRVLELSYTAWDMMPFARYLGDGESAFRWDEERRMKLRAELDAGYFHLYGIGQDDMLYIMETFDVLRRKEQKRFGEYRTERLILEIYDEMAEAIRTRKPYQTVLDPPPGQGPRHPPRDG